MIKKLLFLSILIAVTISQGCKNPEPTPDNSMDNMVVPNGFTFETTLDIPITISMPGSINFSSIKSRFNIYTGNPNNGGKLIFSGSFNEDGEYSGTIKIPATINEITATTIAGNITISLVQISNHKDGSAVFNFGDNYGNNPPDSIVPETKSSENTRFNTSNIFGNRNVITSTNLVTNGDFEVDNFGQIDFWNSPHQLNDIWYLTTRYAATEWYNDGGNHVIRTPYSNSLYAGGPSQIINAEPGDILTFSGDIKSTITTSNNKLKVWLFLIPKDASGNDITYFNYGIITPTTTWTNSQLVATMPQGTVSCQVLFWSHDSMHNQSIMFDNATVTKQVTDTDGDGVDDDLDDYPLDPTRAFNVYYPNQTDWGTFAFEDLWPGKGDYDFNDLILDYQFKSVLNASNELVEFFTDYSVRAIGASLTNGFAFMLPGNPSNVSTITGTNITENYLSLNANGTEQNQPNTVIFLFDNAFTMIGTSGSSFINTVSGSAYIEPDTNQLYVSYINPIANPASAPYNPFIVVDKTRGIEVHMAGEEPTALADQALFGTYADDSDPATGKYYQTENNLPWAIDLPVKFDYAIEQAEIVEAYNYFRSWAESGGTMNENWYEDNAGNRNDQYIYSPPQ